MKYGTDEFFEYLYKETQTVKTLLNCSDDELHNLLELKRGLLSEVLGVERLCKIEHKVEVVAVSAEKKEGYAVEAYDANLLPGLTVPLYLLIPEAPNGKSILYCHGHDDKGCRASFEPELKQAYHKTIPLEMVKRGYTVAVPEFVGYGPIKKYQFDPPSDQACYANSALLLLHGMTLSGLRVFEAIKVIDWMLEEKKLSKPMAFGISGGGQVVSYLGALEERLSASAVSSFGNTFLHSIMAMHHCIDNYIPGLLNIGECPEIMALTLPKPLFLTNGRKDHIFPLAGTNQAIEEIGAIYKRFGVQDRFSFEVFEGGHEISFDEVFDFFEGIAL